MLVSDNFLLSPIIEHIFLNNYASNIYNNFNVSKKRPSKLSHDSVVHNSFFVVNNLHICCKSMDISVTLTIIFTEWNLFVYGISQSNCLDIILFKFEFLLDLNYLLCLKVFSSSIEVSNPGGRPDYSDPTKRELSDSDDDVKPVPAPPTNGRQKSYSCINFPKLLILITIQVMLVAVILHFGFKPIITDEKVNTICANYDFIKSKHDANIDGLGELCEQKDDIFKPPINLLGGAIVLVIAVPQMVFSFFLAIYSA